VLTSFANFLNLSNSFWTFQNSETFMYQKICDFQFNKKFLNVYDKDFHDSFQKQISFLDQNSPATLFMLESLNPFVSPVFLQEQIRFQNIGISTKSQYYLNSVKKTKFNSDGYSLKSFKFFSELALSFLIIGKSGTLMGLNLMKFGSNISAFIFNIIEFFMLNIYKFLEKPAELMIEWIALIFLIEWSSDIITFIPDTFDISVWKSSNKFFRSFRTSNLALSFLSSSFPGSVFSNSWSPHVNGINLINTGIYSNIMSFILYKRLFYFFESFVYEFTQPDIDIFVRQKKGMIFWDIWAEILLKAAEKYNVNIPSFVTLKEEQELFIEKLLQDSEFLKNIQIQNSSSKFSQKQHLNFEISQQNNSTSFIKNYLIKEKPFALENFHFLLNNMDQEKISNLLYSPLFNFRSNIYLPNSKFQNFKNKSILNIVMNLGLFNDMRIKQKIETNFNKNNSFSIFLNTYDRWSCTQYGTYQSPETDLFVDIHPSKSLQHIHYFKYYEPAQYTIGSLICQVYSGLFSKQVSKNILLIGSPGTAKTLFIQALAGETEMKIITDNAFRYSTVQRGVAVGMKYLRDVFDAIALQTPCFFLMENIHAIGSKRPLLISDDENVKGIQTSFGLDQQEVHETNQMIYQLNKHAISDFKRPYKGDFSMGIPTNFFVQNFYSNVEKNSFSIFQNSQFSFGGTNTTSRYLPTYPLPIDSIENSLYKQTFVQNEKSGTDSRAQRINLLSQNNTSQLKSCLQISKEQMFAPPATSPFAVLMMKEQKKFKPKKFVQENSWGGVAADQLISYQKENFSVRAKVAILAEMTMNLSRGKLDMITDLLVIIDSVRSNRGFIVFATTHIPSSLDPALRRPGRFDETISLVQNTNIFNRFEIFKMHFFNSISTIDFLDLSLITENFSELDLFNLTIGTKLSFFHQYKLLKNFNNQSHQTRILSQISPKKALQNFLQSSFFSNFYQKHPIFLNSEKRNS